jgi:esterase/lipase superfamily enzyme
MDRFVICTRAVRGNAFTAEPGPTRYLIVPAGEQPTPAHETAKPAQWLKKLRKAATWGKDSRVPTRDRGDLLVFVHGYNNDQQTVMRRHDRLTLDLKDVGFKGAILSYDWPSEAIALNYLEDRHDAKLTAMQLVTDGIAPLSAEQTPDCAINIHLLGHSTGAYVIREAFDDADDARLPNNAWYVSQIAFIGGDISSASCSASNATTDSLYRHCARLTNYSNLYDSVLKLSNAKRAGVAPRVGRIGLPPDAPAKAGNVDCSAYFQLLSANPEIRAQDQTEEIGTFDHSWHIGNRIFARDLFEVLRGDLDRTVIPTRHADQSGALELVRNAVV